MAQKEGDFEKGKEFGSVDTMNLISYVLQKIYTKNIINGTESNC